MNAELDKLQERINELQAQADVLKAKAAEAKPSLETLRPDILAVGVRNDKLSDGFVSVVAGNDLQISIMTKFAGVVMVSHEEFHKNWEAVDGKPLYLI